MRQALMIAATLGLLGGAATPAGAQRLDINGRCRTADGRLVRTDVCKPSKGARSSAHHLYLRDAQGVCRDEKGAVARPSFCKR